MGFGKSLKKAFKSAVKVVSGGSIVGGLLGGEGDEKKAAVVEAPAQVAAPAAAVVEAPKGEADESDDSDTDSAKKAARAKGKRGLSVARSAGTGINI